jgi:hypothetical protein
MEYLGAFCDSPADSASAAGVRQYLQRRFHSSLDTCKAVLDNYMGPFNYAKVMLENRSIILVHRII